MFYNYFVCKKNHSSGFKYECEKFDNFNQALCNFRRQQPNTLYYSYKEFDSTIIPIFVLNPLKRHTLCYELSKQFNDLYLNIENVFIK